MSSEEELFAQAMGKVKPLDAEARVQKEQPAKKRPSPPQQPRSLSHTSNMRAAHAPEVGEEPWRLVASGVSNERLKRLGTGDPAIDATYDLHGLSREQAQQQLEVAFARAIDQGMRVLRIIHGRGLHSQGKPVLKQALFQWLQYGAAAPMVLAAIAEPGSGGGATLVLLRRSDRS